MSERVSDSKNRQQKDSTEIGKYTLEEGTLEYLICDTHVAIRRFRGIARKVVIPEEIEGKEVRKIEKKAFLSNKNVHEIVLPETVEEIGDWAFAHTENLRSITIPRRDFQKGKELFLGCNRLREIIMHGTEVEREQDQKDGINRMLAVAVRYLHDYFLLSPLEVRKKQWIAQWDEKLIKLIQTDDLDGFEELWTCGEEDYEGKDYDIKSYPVEKRKGKLRLAYFRLLHAFQMSDEVKATLQNYLRAHTKGTNEPESWDILMEEHPEEIEYYQTFAEAGCITQDNFDALIEDMKDANAQMKAFMFQYKEEHLKKKDAFAEFDLDW